MAESIQFLTIAISALITLLTLLALFSDDYRRVHSAPSILTSLGIFGTFLGITVGLSGFNPDDISNSVPHLFSGIKLAFWTSVAGILGGILVKIRLLLAPLEDDSPRDEKEAVMGMHKALSNIEKSLGEQFDQRLSSSHEKLLESLAPASRDDSLQDIQSTLEKSLTAQQNQQEQLAQLLLGDEGLATRLEAQSAASAQHLSEQLDRIGSGLSQNEKASSTHLKQLAETLQAIKAASSEESTALLEKLDGLHSGSESLGKLLGNIDSGLSRNEKSSSERLKQLAASIEALQAANGGDFASMLERLDSLREGSQALGDRLHQVLSDNQGELAEALAGNRDVMAAQITTAVSELRDALVGKDGAANLISKQLDQQNSQLGKSLSQVLSQSSDKLGKSLSQDLKALSKQLDSNQKDASAQLKDLAGAMNQLREASGGDLASVLEGINQLGQHAQTLDSGLKLALSEQQAALVEAYKESGKNLGKDLSDSLSKATERMAKMSQGDLNKLGKRLDDLGSTSQDIAKAAQMAAAEQQAALLGQLGETLQQLGDNFGEKLGSLGSQLAKQLSSQHELRAEQLSELSNSIDSSQAASSGDMQNLLDQLSNMHEAGVSDSQHLHQLISQQQQGLADQLAAGRDALALKIGEAVGELRDALVGPKGVAENINKHLASSQADVLKSLAQSSRDISKALKDDAGKLGEQLSGINEALGGQAEALQSGVAAEVAAINDGMQNLVEGLSGGIGDAMGGLSADLGTLTTAVADAVDDLRMAIVGPEGAAQGLSDELRKAHAQTTDLLGSIRGALEENTQRQVDYSPKELLEVLEEMIRQFNTQFSGQFWEKLGGFSQGIAELLEWMATYRKQLADMSTQQEKSVKNMDKATRRFDEIAGRSEIFIDVAKNISGLLGGLDSQRMQIENHLKQFAHLVDTTRANLEDIEEKIISGHSETNEHVREISQRIEEQVIRMDSALEQELSKSMVTLGQQLAALSEKFVEDYTPLTERLRDVVQIASKV